MIFLEIVMILIGLAAIIASQTMSDSRSLKGTVQGTGVNIDYEKLTKEHLERYREIIDEMSEEVKNESEDRMNTISNEKIMGINEYSDQVLDKIEKNHAEVVFLYNMLNEKQEEIKALVAETDKIKAELRDEMSALYQENMDWIRESKEEVRENTEAKLQDGWGQREAVSGKNTGSKAQPVSSADTTKPADSSTDKSVNNTIHKLVERAAKRTPEKEEGAEVGVFQHKDEILDLHKKGHSVLDISRLLSIGQGEVSFVIELYGNG